MGIIVPHRHILARVRIAVLAQVRAGVVFPDVFAQDAAAELSLAFVAVVPLLEGVLRFAQPDGAGGNQLRAKQGAFHRLYLHAEKVHQNFVVVCETNHQLVIHAAVVLYAVSPDVNLLAAGGQLVMPFPVEFRKTSGELFHLRLRPFPIVYATLFQIGLHLLVCGDVGVAENEFLRVALKLVADIFHFPEQVVQTDLVGQNHRIETPDYPAFAQLVNQPLESVNPFLQWWNAFLQTLFLIIVQRVLDIAADVPVFQLVEVPEQRLRVLRPKHDEAGVLIGDVTLGAVKRVGPRE